MTYLPEMEGERRNLSLSAWFTPPQTARRIVDFALDGRPDDEVTKVLEPSCGRGALIEAMCTSTGMDVTGIDLDPVNIAHCSGRDWGFWRHNFFCADFITHHFDAERFDVAIMNPPYDGGQTEIHIRRALEVCDTVVCHCPLTTLAGLKRHELLWSRHAEITRIAICAKRPRYSDAGGKTDMCTLEIRRARRTRTRINPTLEWWP